MLKIRTELPEDIAAIHDVNSLAFGRENEARLVSALRGSDACLPGLSLVANEAGRVVGHILFTAIRILRDNGPLPAVALAPMCVHPEFQRKGIGSALVETGLEACAALGHRVVIVVGHPQFYPRFGFRPAVEYGVRAPFEVPNEAFMALGLTHDACMEISGVVEYPPEFEDL